MASETDAIAPRTWVAIDIAKGVNVALVEYLTCRVSSDHRVLGNGLDRALL